MMLGQRSSLFEVDATFTLINGKPTPVSEIRFQAILSISNCGLRRLNASF